MTGTQPGHQLHGTLSVAANGKASRAAFRKSWSGVSGAAMVAIALFSSACGSGPPPRLYLLELPSSTALDQSTEPRSIKSLGISQVEVPGYASDARIPARQENGVVVQLDDQRWAEEPEDAITRLLAEQLRRHSEATVLIEPWPRDYNPQARVEVTIDRLLREPDGGAHMSGQIHLISGDGRKLLQSLAFDQRQPGRSLDITEFFTATAIIIDEVARLSVDALLDRTRPS